MHWLSKQIISFKLRIINIVDYVLSTITNLQLAGIVLFALFASNSANATTVEFNSSGGSSTTNGLHFYIDDSTQLQVKRLNNSGQVYDPALTPPNSQLDNGIYLRANTKLYGPTHNVVNGFTFAPSGGAFTSRSITAVSPVNPATSGDQQIATHQFGVTSGPQVTINWKYTIPFDFITAEVTLVIPSGYAISASNPVRYYHVADTFLGGSDSGCGVKFTDSNGKTVIGTYPPLTSTCPSTTSVPTGISVVESFRERSGLSFSSYCATSWSSFWISDANSCLITQNANLSNDITNTYEDTGIGIQYNFTSAGTYTFSYDFVVGSTIVPAYDHLEIRHPGTATLCPATLTVLACTSTTVPCPAANIVNTGTLTGSIKNTPAAPALTQTPSSFTLGSTASTATVTLQGSGAGAYVLSATGLSSTPLNGTKCWNTTTSTSSCAYVVTNTACVSNFDCMETGITYNNLTTSPSARNPLYTKLTGTNFKFDVVALQSSGATATSYTASSGVTVELFDDSTSPQPSCSAYTSPIASQAITFVTGDSGRKTLPANFTIANAYKKLRCRVKDTNVSVYGCSSDNFAVRPTSFTVSSSNANADATGASTTATPRLAAGSNFVLTASTGLTNYNGTASIDNTKLTAHTSAVQTGTLTGNFSVASAGTATGAAFKYSEVGYFKFNANGVYDDSFTAIDSTVGDCVSGFTASGNKFGCSFGNSAATNYFGRFIPDHFDTIVIQGCSTGAFTYSAQPFNTQITARHSGGGRTQNYDSAASFSKNLVLSDANAVATGSLASATVAASAFSAGIANATPSFNFNTAKTAP
ncbi:MAG: hypothetical protein HOO90_12010, partial [Methylotenera sp.]|uniref:DUF6701 domain-containing protein n=1 Tax=Methylotenera sp. TaxID=2051956 RepID=UPI001814C227|nr:hypothetical protein [Methylotenera sp.]